MTVFWIRLCFDNYFLQWPYAMYCIRHIKNSGIFIAVYYQVYTSILNGIKVQVFSEKNIEKKYLCHHDQNYCYSCKSNIPLINLIVDSRNMIKLCKKLDKRQELFSANADNFLAFFFFFFFFFLWGIILESAMNK